MRKLLRSLGLACARFMGTRLVDCKTGQVLGKVLIVPWRGRILFIGLQTSVLPSFQPQSRLTYWKQELGFTVHLPPDFPPVEHEASPSVEER